MAGYICALAISLFAVVAGSFCMVYPLYQTIVIQHNVSPSSYEIGDQVELLYNQNAPEQYYIPHASGGNWAFLLGGAFFFLMGLVFTVLIVKVWLN